METQVNAVQHKIIINRPQLSLSIGGTPPTYKLEKPVVTINPPANGGVGVNIVCQVLAGAGSSGEIPMMTQSEYDALPTKNRQLFYFVTDDNGTLIKIYAGYRLIAYSNESGAFTYNFPFTLA